MKFDVLSPMSSGVTVVINSKEADLGGDGAERVLWLEAAQHNPTDGAQLAFDGYAACAM